jgi:hypothetical protein
MDAFVSPLTRARLVAALLTALLVPSAVLAGAEPAPPYPPAPPASPPPPVYYPPPPPPRVAPPPPLSPFMRAVYAPFYAAGLVVRYGVYYVIVAPLEVFSRTLTYGVEGGAPRRSPEDAS